MAFVVDASVALSWFFEDESSDDTDAVLERTAREPVVVPAHWFFELLNGALVGERRGRSGPEMAAGMKERIALMEVEVEAVDAAVAFARTLPLARAHRLTLYDAAYLELAERRGLPLATRDAKLAAAARALGMEVLP